MCIKEDRGTLEVLPLMSSASTVRRWQAEKLRAELVSLRVLSIETIPVRLNINFVAASVAWLEDGVARLPCEVPHLIQGLVHVLRKG